MISASPDDDELAAIATALQVLSRRANAAPSHVTRSKWRTLARSFDDPETFDAV